MTTVTAKRTLVRSPPELWEELSDGKHISVWLGEALGEAPGSPELVHSEPQRRAVWRYRGDGIERAETEIELERKGWGTRVTLTGELKLRGLFADGRERVASERMLTALERTLDELGTNQRRPFSRN